jgi:hypothetical protein
MSEITIRKPTAKFGARQGAPAFNLDRPIKGLRVGLRNDHMWQSWLQVCDEWTDMLRRDGAEPVLLRVGEHGGEEAQNTKKILDKWASSIDCAVVGFAN